MQPLNYASNIPKIYLKFNVACIGLTLHSYVLNNSGLNWEIEAGCIGGAIRIVWIYNVQDTRVTALRGYIAVITCRMTSARRTYMHSSSVHPRTTGWLLINVRRSNRIAIKLTIATWLSHNHNMKEIFVFRRLFITSDWTMVIANKFLSF